MTQLAKLYLRGSLVKTIQTLSDTEREKIGDLIELIVDDPCLQNTKHEFCNALRRTISNEYADKDVGLEDYRVAIMRAVIAAKYGWGKHEPAEGVFTDPIQRKKWFQNWAFNYLRQILRENKIPGYKQTKSVSMPADMAVIEEVNNLIRKEIDTSPTSTKKYLRDIASSIEVKEEGLGYRIFVDQWSLPVSLLEKIQDLSNKYLSHNVEVSHDGNGIRIKPLSNFLPSVEVQQHKAVRVRFSNFESQTDDDNGSRYYLELEVSELNNHEERMAESDSMRALRNALPDDAKVILQLITDPPSDFVDKYGDKVYKSNIAKYLEMRDREVDRIMNIIRVNAMSLGIGVER